DERAYKLQFNRGMDATNRRDGEQAVAAFTEALRVAPNDTAIADAYNGRGLALHLLKDRPDEALADYNEAVAYNPNHADAFNNRALIDWSKKELGQMLRDAERQIQLVPNHRHAYNTRGLYYLEKKDYDRAVQDFTRATELYPTDATAYNSLGYALILKR